MFTKKNKKNEIELTSTVIGEGTEIKCANFSTKGNVRLSGKIVGDLAIEGQLIIDDNGCVEGNVEAIRILCSGSVVGNITCQEEIHLSETGSHNGNIVAAAIIIDEGAEFCGNCVVKKKDVNVTSINKYQSRLGDLSEANA